MTRFSEGVKPLPDAPGWWVIHWGIYDGPEGGIEYECRRAFLFVDVAGRLVDEEGKSVAEEYKPHRWSGPYDLVPRGAD